MKYNSQSRKYLLTINNPDNCEFTQEVVIERLKHLTLDYWCLCSEIASTGTPHIHIFMYSHSPIRFSTLKNVFPIAHIERAYGSVIENRNYLLKEGKWADTSKADTKIEDSFVEWGDIPSEGAEKAPLIAQIMDEIREGKTISRIIQEYPNYAFRIKELDAIREAILSEKYTTEYRDISVTYIYGDTGTGKTSSIYKQHHPCDICRITSYSSNGIKFDAYRGQIAIIFEEYRSQIPLSDFLSYLDIYPIYLPARFYDRVACYSHVYILSNIPLEQQYVNLREHDPTSWNALIRRINHIYHQVDINTRLEIPKEVYYAKE